MGKFAIMGYLDLYGYGEAAVGTIFYNHIKVDLTQAPEQQLGFRVCEGVGSLVLGCWVGPWDI